MVACPYCGKEYPTVTIPGIFGGASRTIQSRECGCAGELEAKRERERAERAEALRTAWASTGVPTRYMGVAQDKEGAQRILEGHGLYFYGPRGTGKTQSACSVLKAYVAVHTDSEGRCGAAFVSVPDWLASMRGAWGEDEERAYNRAASRSLLVLDDLGKGKPTQWALERLFRLVDDRYNKLRPTVYTSQYGLGELAQRLGWEDRETAEAIVSRIHETCTGVRMDGPDLRKNQKK